jgi:hypothetical protein
MDDHFKYCAALVRESSATAIWHASRLPESRRIVCTFAFDRDIAIRDPRTSRSRAKRLQWWRGAPGERTGEAGNPVSQRWNASGKIWQANG